LELVDRPVLGNARNHRIQVAMLAAQGMQPAEQIVFVC